MKQKTKVDIDNRIWELDAIRGIAIILVLAFHVPYFLETFAHAEVPMSPFLTFVRQYGGAFFIFLSGICVAFSRDSYKRGVIVFICGLVLTVATGALYELGYETQEVLMQWNILEMIGLSMILYQYYRKWPNGAIIIIGMVIIVLGYYITENVRVTNPNLYLLGFKTRDFISFEWRPVLPNLGWFMLGSGLKPYIYKERKSLIPQITERTPIINVFCALGRWSLPIYMIHMPIYYIAIRYFVK